MLKYFVDLQYYNIQDEQMCFCIARNITYKQQILITKKESDKLQW